MSEILSQEVERLVREQIDGRQFTCADEVLRVAMRLLKEYQSHYRQRLAEDIKKGFDQLERGDGIELEDDAALRAFFDDIQRRGRQRYEASRIESTRYYVPTTDGIDIGHIAHGAMDHDALMRRWLSSDE